MSRQEKREKEEWKSVAGYFGRYEVSNKGRVRSLDYHLTGRVQDLKPSLDGGYPQVVLCEDGNQKTKKVHVLVLEAFVCPRPKNLVCDHIDAVKTNNRVENLEWVTCKENTIRGRGPEVARRLCRIKIGTKNPSSKLTENQVIAIRQRYEAGGVTQKELGRKNGIVQSVVSSIINRNLWKHV